MVQMTRTFSIDQLDRIFPFHFVVNDHLELVYVSKNLEKVCGKILNARLHDFFEFDGYKKSKLSFDYLYHSATKPFKIRRKNNKAIALKGVFEPVNHGTQMMFIAEAEISEEDSENVTKQAIDKLLANNQIFNKISKESVDGILIADNDGSIEWVNDGFQKLTGFTIKECLGKRPRTVLYGADSQQIDKDYVDTKILERKPFSFENIGYTKGGKKFWFKATVQPIINENNEIIGRFSTVVDITDSKTKEFEIKQQKELVDLALESGDFGFWKWEINSPNLTLSPKYKDLLGLGAIEELDLKSFLKLVYPDDVQKIKSNYWGSMTPQKPTLRFEHRVKTKLGLYRYFEARGKATKFDAQGRAIAVIGTVSDVTSKVEKDLSIQLHSQQLASILDNLNDGILSEDENNIILTLNSTFCSLFNIKESPDYYINQSCESIKSYLLAGAADPLEFGKMIIDCKVARQKMQGKLLKMIDGKTLSVDFIPFENQNSYLGHIWKIKDVTNDVSKTNEIADTKNFYEKILDNIPADIAILSKNHKYVYTNKHAIKNDEMRAWIIGKNDFDYYTRKGDDTSKALTRQKHFNKVLETRKTVRFVEEYQKPSGIVSLLRLFSPIINEENEIEFIVGYGLDITQQKAIEAKLTAQKEYYQNILNRLPVDIVVLDKNDRFKFINKNGIKNDELRNRLLGFDNFEYCRIKGISDELAIQRRGYFLQVLESKSELTLVEDMHLANGERQHMLRKFYPVLNNHNNEVEEILIAGLDITAQVNQQNLLKSQKEETRNMLDSISEGVFKFDALGNILLMNKAFADAMCINEAAVETQTLNFYKLLKVDQLSVMIDKINTLRATGEPQILNLLFDAGGENERHYQFKFLNFSTGDNLIVTARVSDITETIVRERLLNENLEKERQLNALKTKFIRIASHELRTPLSVILANSDLLDLIFSNGNLNEEKVKRILSRINKEVHQMTEILNQLIMINKIEEGETKLEKSNVNLIEFSNVLMGEFFAPYKDGRSLQLVTNNPEIELVCDIRLLRLALLNVIDNAFKYSELKPAPILRLYNSDTDVIIVIEDFGIGIPDSETKNLFKSFFRAGNVGNIQGTGIGLTIVDYVIKLHGGKVVINSVQNQGTTITITIPKQ